MPKILISRSIDIPVIEKEQLKNVIVQSRKRERSILKRFIIGKILGEDVQAKAAKKEGRIAAEGLCQIKVDGNVAVMVEVNSETDFVAKNEEFTNFVDYLVDEIIKRM